MSKSTLPEKEYEEKLEKLQEELCMLQSYVREHGLRIVVVFEGRDTAGKGGTIKRIVERVSPRIFRVVALPAPSDREKSQMYLQRYIQHMPAKGEIVLFDRSWYNRAGVEKIMGFCTTEEYQKFLVEVPAFESWLVEDGIILIKYFLDVNQEEQERRFIKRVDDPLRQWKLSPMDITSYRKWWDYTEAYEAMIQASDTDKAPWYRIDTDDKRRSRLNCISHLLSLIPYKKIHFEKPDFGEREERKKGQPKKITFRHTVPSVY
jgi:polyphosphate kinase 2